MPSGVFPPLVLHHAHDVSPSTALTLLLQTYLADTQAQPYLHPDARLAERGPQLAASEDGGLVLHHLRRVEAALRGERLGDLDLDGAGAGAEMDLDDQAERAGAPAEARAETKAEDWQDMDDYARQQDIEEGEPGPRDTGLGDGGVVPRLKSAPVDRQERKLTKKKRRKDEQRQVEERRRRQAAQEE